MLREILSTEIPTVGRRQFISGAAALAAGASVSAGSKSTVAATSANDYALKAPLDFSNPENNLLGYVQILGDVSGEPTYNWGHGRVYGAIENELSTPLFDYHSCRFSAWRRLTDGSWMRANRAVILMTDIETGEVIDNFRNPYTDKDNEIIHFKSAFGAAVFTVNGARALAEFESEGDHGDKPFILPWQVIGDDAWMTYDERIAYRRNDGEWRVDNAVYRYHAHVSELTNPDVPAPNHHMMWSTELNWFSYMEMGDHPGHVIWHGMGRKYHALDEVPEVMVAGAEQRFPGFLTTPIDWSEYGL